MSFTLVSCDDDMDISSPYPSRWRSCPCRTKVTKGQTVEIRCELKKEGDFSGTLYTIRYFQFGEGSLKMDNGITFLPNDRYLLENEKVPPVLHGGGVTRRIISSWWWRITLATPTNWNLTSTTGM